VTEPLQRLVDHLLYIVFVSDIGVDRQGLRKAAEFACSLLQPFLIDIGDHHPCFLLRKCQSRMPPDSFAAARDNSYFSLKHGSTSSAKVPPLFYRRRAQTTSTNSFPFFRLEIDGFVSAEFHLPCGRN
jgi:hypothetical protein